MMSECDVSVNQQEEGAPVEAVQERLSEQDWNDHDLYPVHEEDSVPETPAHFRQIHHLVGGLQAFRPDLWVTGDTCRYWEPGNTVRYVAPDMAVIATTPPAHPENVSLLWKDAPLLFVAEVGSRSTLKPDTGPKVSTYERHLRVPEYLYCDPPRGDLRLWRSVEGRFERVVADARGYLWSDQLQLWFGYDASGFLRMITPEGQVILTQEEEHEARIVEERRRLDAERRVAELEAEIARLRNSQDA